MIAKMSNPYRKGSVLLNAVRLIEKPKKRKKKVLTG